MDIWGFIQEQFQQNEFFKGGAVLAILGSLLVYARSLPSKIYGFLSRRLTFSVSFDSKDALFDLFNNWVNDQKLAKRKNIVRIQSNQKIDPPQVNVVFDRNKRYLVRFHSMWILIGRAHEDKPVATKDESFQATMAPPEMYTLRTAIWNKKRLLKQLNEVLGEYSDLTRNEIQMYRGGWGGSWYSSSTQRKRDFSKLVLRRGLYEEISNDMDEFISSRDWYDTRQIPYQRGYLLSGPPGTGKTSIALALASKYGLKICPLSLPDVDSDSSLKELFEQTPGKALILIEDFDSFFEGRKNTRQNSKITFSGFLNAINGVTCNPGRVLLLTTNIAQSVDPALTRIGRIDKHFHIGYLDEDQTIRLFKLYFPEISGDERVSQFAKEIAKNEIPPSDLVGHFLVCKKDPSLLFNIDAFLKERNERVEMEQTIKKESREELKAKEEMGVDSPPQNGTCPDAQEVAR